MVVTHAFVAAEPKPAIRFHKVSAPAADTGPIAIALALGVESHEFRKQVISWLKKNWSSKVAPPGDLGQTTLKDIWERESRGGRVYYLARTGGKQICVSSCTQWCFYMQKEGTFMDMLFRCAVAAKYNVKIVIGDLETGDPDGPLEGTISPAAPISTIRIFWSFNDESWYRGQEIEGGTETEEDLGYVNLNRYSTWRMENSTDHAEAVHVHKLEHKQNDEAFFDALACALNHDLLVRSPSPSLYSVHSVKAAIRKYFNDTKDAFKAAFKTNQKNQIGIISVKTKEKCEPSKFDDWLNWNLSGDYYVDSPMIRAVAACFASQIIVVKMHCTSVHALFQFLNGFFNPPTVPNQVIVPESWSKRIYLVWQPAGYDWGHSHHCSGLNCPEPPVDVFFCAPEIEAVGFVEPAKPLLSEAAAAATSM